MSPLSIEIMEFFKDNQDKRFKCYQVAFALKVSAKEVWEQLQTLPISTDMNGRSQEFWLESDEVKARTVERRTPISQIQRPKRDNRAMQEAMNRCKEVYPDGGNFKTIS